jgi:hypothetical protein
MYFVADVEQRKPIEQQLVEMTLNPDLKAV